MARASLKDIAERMDVFTHARVVRPNWRNPADAEGVGLELVTDLTLEVLLKTHRSRLMALTYGAQFLQVYTASAPLPVAGQGIDDTPLPLNHERHVTDMIWHTDKVHRDHGSVNVIVGESSVPSGLASKAVIGRAMEQATGATRNLWAQLHLHLHRLKTGQAGLLYSDTASDILADVWQNLEVVRRAEANIAELQAEFWSYVQAIGDQEDILWIGQTPAEYAGRTQAIFTAITGYHCKHYDAMHGVPSTRQKFRLELRPTQNLRRHLDAAFQHLSTQNQAPSGLDEAWVEALPER